MDRRIGRSRPQPSVLAITAGYLRDAELSTALASGTVGRFVALDPTPIARVKSRRTMRPLGLETVHVRCATSSSVRHILGRKVKLGTFRAASSMASTRLVLQTARSIPIRQTQ
jgi:hypothetical protein